MENTQNSSTSFFKNVKSAPIAQNSPVNLAYQYTSDDIWMAIKAGLFKNNYSFGDKTYLLEHIFQKQEHYVAITPPVDATAKSSTPIDFFLNKTNQAGSLLYQHLATIFPILDELKKLNDEEILKRMKEVVGHLIIDETAYQALLDCIKEKDFDLARLQQKAATIDAIERHDVFDEIMPLFLNSSSAQIKILFPYNTNARNLDPHFINGHWLTGEINLHKTENNYRVITTAHNPYGVGKIEQSKELEQSISQE